MDGLPGDWRVVEPPASAPPNPLGSKPPAADWNRVWVIALAVGVAGLLLAGTWMLGGSADSGVGIQVAAIEETLASPSGARATAPRLLVVDVGGAVRRPGVYRLPDGARIVDAIEAAGGFAPTVDAAAAAGDLNLAAPLADGDRVRVPVRGGTRAAGGTPRSAAVATHDPGDGLLDLNRATIGELEALPAIGPATAAKIVAAREELPFASVDDLRARKILGESAFVKVRDLVTVR